jgi:hypothetical protein
MRLKVAEVLVDDGRQVNQLADVFPQGGQIVEQHKNLWAISVYANREVATEADGDTRTADALLAYVKDRLDVPLTRWDGQPVLGKRDLALQRVSDEAQLTRAETAQLQEYVVAAKGGSDTFDSLTRQTWMAARQIKPKLSPRPPKRL